VLNIGGGRPVGLLRMIEVLEGLLGAPAQKIMRPMQSGDVTATFADVAKLHALTGYSPHVTLEEGLPKFVDWYREFYR
jgi:UDP-glucuronate 4-epimerase